MSYEPTQWSAGDTVTSAKLNKMEQGIAANGGILIVHVIENENNPTTLDKTWQEIHDADVCYVIYHDDELSTCDLIASTSINDNKYRVMIISFTGLPQYYVADSHSDYPILDITPISDQEPNIM